jgi:hypothetical protein
MAVTDSSAVPQLSKDGSNLWRWENALKLYAQANAYDQLLKGTWERPIVVVPDLLKEPTQYGTSTIPDQATLNAAIQRVRQDNDHSKREYARDQQEHQRWQAAEAALKLAILNTVPKDLYEGIMEQSVTDQFTSVLSRFRDQGVTEECTVWANFFKLRASHCATTSVFTDQFKAGLAKVDKMECIISGKCKVYQFILAIEDTYPSYARDRRSDLRRGVTLSINHMCNELNDEARRDDPIKSAAFGAKQNADNGNNSNNNTPRGGRSHRGRGSGRGGRGGGGGDNDDRKTTPTDDKRSALRAYCNHCKHTHIGAGDNCYFTFPHKAPEAWRARNADKIKTETSTGTANIAIVTHTEPEVETAFDTFSFAAVKLSADVLSQAGRSDYKKRFILDTGSSDHICNDYSKFTSFSNDPNFHAVIDTGAGPIVANRKGTIEITVLTSNGSLHRIQFTNVLYAPDMFVSVLSHSMLREKNLYYHGWDEKLYKHPDKREIAYTPEIDRIPTFLLANDKIEAAQAFAFAAANTTPNTQRSSVLTPTREVSLYELHELFGHADPQALRQLVNNTTGLRLTNDKSFSCEVCLLGNSKKQISRRPPNRSTSFLHRVHIDIVGPLTPVGLNGEQYWIIYTDDYTRYRWIDVVDCKQVITATLVRFLNRMETQHGVRIAICHLDNDTALINKDTRDYLA